MDRAELEGLDRESLVLRAQASGIRRARILTRPELIDELLRLDPDVDENQLKRSRGFFGRARDLLARVVERGLHLPDAADRIRTSPISDLPPRRVEPQALPTVTLAEIYAAQGYRQRAIDTLKRVLEREPEHVAARGLLARLEDASYVGPAPHLPPEPEVEAIPAPPPEPDMTLESPMAGSVVAPPMTAVPAVDADECVALPAGDGAMYVWWRLRDVTLDGLASRAAAFVARVVVIEPSWDGPKRDMRDVELDPRLGAILLRDLPSRGIARVAVGWLDGYTFRPLAHSPALEPAAVPTPGESNLLRWTRDGVVPVTLEDPGSHAIAAAMAGAAAAH